MWLSTRTGRILPVDGGLVPARSWSTPAGSIAVENRRVDGARRPGSDWIGRDSNESRVPSDPPQPSSGTPGALSVQAGGVQVHLTTTPGQATPGVVVINHQSIVTPTPPAPRLPPPGPQQPSFTLFNIPLLVLIGLLSLAVSVATVSVYPVVFGALFAAAFVYSKVKGERTRAAQIAQAAPQSAIARAAQRRGGVFTTADIVADTGLSFENVDAELARLAAAGHVALDNDPATGLVFYRLPNTAAQPQLGTGRSA
jgi:hypothetical protein